MTVRRDSGYPIISPDDEWFSEIAFTHWIFDGFEFLETGGPIAMPANCFERQNYAVVVCLDTSNASLLFLARHRLGVKEYFRYSLDHDSDKIRLYEISQEDFRRAESKAAAALFQQHPNRHKCQF